jgi:hypothetical protein
MKCRRCLSSFPATQEFFVSVRGVIRMRPLCLICHAKECREKRQGRRARGLCHCGVPPKEGRKMCERHLAEHSNFYYHLRRNSPKWRAENNKRSKETYEKLKRAAFDAYGRVCACCGECHREFLSIDHVKQVGTKKGGRPFGSRNGLRRPTSVRATNRSGLGLYRLLKKIGYPSEFRVLCMNCNFALGHSGYCPHKREKSKKGAKKWAQPNRIL